MKELHPAAVTVAGALVAYTIMHLDNKLALMAMLHVLLCNKYSNFILLLMRKWFKHLEEVLLQLGFSCIHADSLIFIWANNNVRMICTVFVNNITFALKSMAKIAELKVAIAQHFKLRNLGPTMFQLGVEITCKCSQCTLHLLQHRYTQDLLEHYSFVDSSPVLVSTPPFIIFALFFGLCICCVRSDFLIQKSVPFSALDLFWTCFYFPLSTCRHS
jgi:hypothetical protein